MLGGVVVVVGERRVTSTGVPPGVVGVLCAVDAAGARSQNQRDARGSPTNQRVVDGIMDLFVCVEGEACCPRFHAGVLRRERSQLEGDGARHGLKGDLEGGSAQPAFPVSQGYEGVARGAAEAAGEREGCEGEGWSHEKER